MAFTAQQRYKIIRNFQLARTRKFLGNPDPIQSSVGIETSYYKALRQIVRQLTNAVKSQVLPILKQAEPQYVQDSSLEELVNRTLSDIESQIGDIESTGTRIAAAMATRGEAFNRARFVATINKSVGISVADIVTKDVSLPVIEASVKANVDLIKTIPPQYLERVQKAVTQGLQRGDNFFSIRESILEVGQSTNRRAKIIARDQVTKLNAALTENRQQALGITEYVWRTASDDRVRPEHEDNDGKTFAWSDPPSTGHPGTEVLCRCVAEPKIDHLFDR